MRRACGRGNVRRVRSADRHAHSGTAADFRLAMAREPRRPALRACSCSAVCNALSAPCPILAHARQCRRIDLRVEGWLVPTGATLSEPRAATVRDHGDLTRYPG